MPRKLRVEYPGAMCHVMSRGDRCENIFLDDVDRQDFLKTLAEACQKAGWQVHAYCLMRVDRLLGEQGIQEDSAVGRQEFERQMEVRRVEEADEEELKRFCIGSKGFKITVVAVAFAALLYVLMLGLCLGPHGSGIPANRQAKGRALILFLGYTNVAGTNLAFFQLTNRTSTQFYVFPCGPMCVYRANQVSIASRFQPQLLGALPPNNRIPAYGAMTFGVIPPRDAELWYFDVLLDEGPRSLAAWQRKAIAICGRFGVHTFDDKVFEVTTPRMSQWPN
jgi:hypothetical protein